MKRRLVGPIAVAGAVAALCALVFTRDPHEAGHYPLCPFRAVTGLDCPACGGLRAMNDLLHGHLTRALDHNALVVLAVPVVTALWIAWTRRRIYDRTGGVDLPMPLVWAAVGVLLGFWVMRNVPGVPFLDAA